MRFRPDLRSEGLLAAAWLLVFLQASLLCGAAIPPGSADPNLEFSLFAGEPDIVTPIGIAVDKRNRIFVVESHTHFPKKDYPGPKYDRVKIFQDTDGDGRADKSSVFADGLHHSMNLAFSPEGELFLTHRNGVLVLHDKDGDGVSEARTAILEMETRGDYPHNGIGGITFGPGGWLYVGLGENLGENYRLKGSDGSFHSGGGEGGNIFRCRPDGSQLQFVATGFWNPFALAFDRAGHLLAVDNDPDSRPPCRLLDVVQSGDYGFKFRYGRSGLHPFIAWNGELPGTLPMMAGTGEAPSGILDCDRARLPSSYRGALLVTSWGDHFIELYRPKPFGASLRADREILVRGDEWFRPVGIAPAPDGTVFITDWVDRDYSVHRKGRIWRLAAKSGIRAAIVAAESKTPRLAPATQRMNRLLNTDAPDEVASLIRALSEDDPFIRSAAIRSLARPIFRKNVLKEIENRNPAVRLGALLALRRAIYEDPVPLLHKLLADADEKIRLMALVWIGEESLAPLAGELKSALSAGPVSPALFRTYAATAEILLKANPSAGAGAAAQSSSGANEARVQLLAMTAQHDAAAAMELLSKPGRAATSTLRLEAVRSLAETPDSRADTLLVKTALEKSNPPELRAESILALAGQPPDSLVNLIKLLRDPDAVIQIETTRAFRQASSDRRVRAALQQRLQSVRGNPHETLLAGQLQFALNPPGTADSGPQANPPARPGSDEEWRKALASGGEPGSGRRVFFHPAVGCSKCHRIEDHGGRIGPDLSTIARASDREKLMQSILHPSREIAPQFVQHTIESRDHGVYSGLLAGHGPDGSVTLVMADGRGVMVPGDQIASDETSAVSLMPEGLENAMTVQDFRDLLAFLLSLN